MRRHLLAFYKVAKYRDSAPLKWFESDIYWFNQAIQFLWILVNEVFYQLQTFLDHAKFFFFPFSLFIF